MKHKETIEILNPKVSYEVAKITNVNGVFERVGDEVINLATNEKQGIAVDSLIKIVYLNAIENMKLPMREITVDDCKAVRSFIVSKLKGTL